MSAKTKGKYRLDPIDVSADVWIYEDANGVAVIKRGEKSVTEARIPWTMLFDLVDNYRKINK